jgi:hypothetical protein
MTQVKFTIESSVVSSFKDRCLSEGVSMASVVARFMASPWQPIKDTGTKVDTRPNRKKAVLECVASLERILQMEEQYRDAIPEQFEARHGKADHSCEQLAEAISLLEDAY